jgi:hypothetical protein
VFAKLVVEMAGKFKLQDPRVDEFNTNQLQTGRKERAKQAYEPR